MAVARALMGWLRCRLHVGYQEYVSGHSSQVGGNTMVSLRVQWRIGALLCLVLVSLAVRTGSGQQEFTNNFKYNSGQSVQPVYEGWSRTSDGYLMHFGYLNRNYEQRPSIPVGPNNRFEPGNPDRGQPTFFYNRTHRNLFTVAVPRDFGATTELVWTVTVNGKSERAVGWLQPDWEIDPAGGAVGGGNTSEEYVSNRPPSVTVAAVSGARVGQAVTLSATASDDGIPKPRPRGAVTVGQETPPTLVGPSDSPVNVPSIVSREVPPGATRPRGSNEAPATNLSVRWLIWRGPAEVQFTPVSSLATSSQVTTQATFTVPGEYVIRAVASDTFLARSSDVTVVVTR
jgi:hypothetical protein